MRLKIRITGPKVHNVGYRPYLAEIAMRLALRGFEVYNDDGSRVNTTENHHKNRMHGIRFGNRYQLR